MPIITARIIAYAYEDAPAYLPSYDGTPVLASEVGASVRDNWDAGRHPQQPDLRVGHDGEHAIGWVQRLYEADDGLYADIELTDEGAWVIIDEQAIKYVSPSLGYGVTLPSGERIDGWVLLHIAATNDPAQYGAAAILLSRGETTTLTVPAVALSTLSQSQDGEVSEQDGEVSEPTESPLQLREAENRIMEQIMDRLAQIEAQIESLRADATQREQERTLVELQRELESWRYDGDRAIPPSVARQYALMLSRIPEPYRTEAMLTLRANPPTTVRLSRASMQMPMEHTERVDPTVRHYLQQLGVTEEDYRQYKIGR